ncbi:MAG: low molecular weight protein arginine phosphatase [Firmicutes bacterium]|nr:low molecular weight protein arginine phosphatase [Bacillota bacterium]
MYKKILLVCTGNTCRSPMAAALLRKILEKRGKVSPELQIASAGLYADPGAPASPEAVEAMREYGVDLTTHRARGIERAELLAAELILTMTAGHKEQLVADYPEIKDKVYVLREFIAEKRREKGEEGLGDGLAAGHDRIGFDLPDPFGHNLEVYRCCAAVLAEELEALVQILAGE